MLTKIEEKDAQLYKGSLQDFQWEKPTHWSIDDVCPDHFVDKNYY